MFAKLQGLERLYLQHNNLTRVPPNLPRSLRDLRLNNNNINKVTTLRLLTTTGPSNTFIHLHLSSDVFLLIVKWIEVFQSSVQVTCKKKKHTLGKTTFILVSSMTAPGLLTVFINNLNTACFVVVVAYMF